MHEADHNLVELQNPDLDFLKRLKLIEDTIKIYSQVDLSEIKEQIIGLQVLKAKCLNELKRDNESLSILKKILYDDPYNIDALIELGYYYMSHNDFKTSIFIHEEILELDSTQALALYNIGICYLKENDLNGGIDYLKQSLRFEEDESTYFDLALAYFKLKNNDRAEKYLREGLYKYPNSISLHELNQNKEYL